MHFKCAKNFLCKILRNYVFAHIKYAVALTANRNKIVYHLWKLSFKNFTKTGEKFFLFSETFLAFYSSYLAKITFYFLPFKRYLDLQIFNTTQIEVFLTCFVESRLDVVLKKSKK